MIGDIMDDNTSLYSLDEFEDSIVKDTLKDVYEALEERGYNPVNQLVGYLVSGDPGYISSHKEARNKMTMLDRNRIIEVLLKGYLNK